MNKFDLRDAPNRRVQRAMEKENKKIREAAKRERNETVRVSQLSLYCLIVGFNKFCFYSNWWHL